MIEQEEKCNHIYRVGYSARVPEIFHKSLPCDECGCQIRLRSPYRLIYWIIYLSAFILGFKFEKNIDNLLVLDNKALDFMLEILAILIIALIVQLIVGVLFRFGKWIEIDS